MRNWEKSYRRQRNRDTVLETLLHIELKIIQLYPCGYLSSTTKIVVEQPVTLTVTIKALLVSTIYPRFLDYWFVIFQGPSYKVRSTSGNHCCLIVTMWGAENKLVEKWFFLLALALRFEFCVCWLFLWLQTLFWIYFLTGLAFRMNGLGKSGLRTAPRNGTNDTNGTNYSRLCGVTWRAWQTSR